ncbi:MAG: hypothetical protein HQL32_18275 [Planctomycetes bacterium]|nr:hypothetical protein [Planctomycetota bacterium]
MAQSRKRGSRRKSSKRKRSDDVAGWRRSPITGALAFAIILYCLYDIFSGTSSDSRYKLDYVCNACQISVRQPPVKGSPSECPECGKVELYSGMHCAGCNKDTPLLDPITDFTCSSCSHHEEGRFSVTKAPHPCPKCSQVSFLPTYECYSCKHIFPFDQEKFREEYMEEMKAQYAEMGEDEDMPIEDMMDESMPFEETVKCPKCKEFDAYSFSTGDSSCAFCNSSDNLQSITPLAVIKYEIGRKLSKSEQRTVDEWKAAQ